MIEKAKENLELIRKNRLGGLNRRDPRREKRRIEGMTATGWGIKKGICYGGLRTSRLTFPGHPKAMLR